MIHTIEQADKITMTWIVQNVDLDNIIPMKNYPSNVTSPIPPKFDMPALGSWMLDDFDGSLAVLIEIPIDEMRPSEGEWNIALMYASTQRYIEWFRAGYEPPPLFVLRNKAGERLSCNRRRWLAAREAGIKSLKCWYSPTHHIHHASPKWSMRWISDRCPYGCADCKCTASA